MTAVPLVELDERIKEELQPPCDVETRQINGLGKPITQWLSCEKPAAWAVSVVCECGTDVRLACDGHKRLLSHSPNCPGCKTRLLVTGLEPLR